MESHDNNRKCTFEIEVESECDKHGEYEPNCDKCIPYCMQIAATHEYINKVKNGNDIIAPKSMTLKIDFPLKRPFLFGNQKIKENYTKEFMRTVCNIYKHIYKEEDETASKCRGYGAAYFNRGKTSIIWY